MLDLWIDVQNRDHFEKDTIHQWNISLKRKEWVMSDWKLTTNNHPLVYYSSRGEIPQLYWPHQPRKLCPRSLHASSPLSPLNTLKEKPVIIPPLIIENDDKSLSYVPDQVAEDLVNNLINFWTPVTNGKSLWNYKISSQEDSLNNPCPNTRNYRWSKQ